MLPTNIPGFRVELVIALFGKVIDLPEFHRVLFALSYPERMAVRERLGWLNMCVYLLLHICACDIVDSIMLLIPSAGIR